MLSPSRIVLSLVADAAAAAATLPYPGVAFKRHRSDHPCHPTLRAVLSRFVPGYRRTAANHVGTLTVRGASEQDKLCVEMLCSIPQFSAPLRPAEKVYPTFDATASFGLTLRKIPVLLFPRTPATGSR